MQCLEYKELISADIDDELAKKEVKKLLYHLEFCAECKEELRKFTLQKEKLIPLHISYIGPVPDPDFSQKVMARIEQETPSPKISKSHQLISELLHWFFLPLKKPAYAMIFSVIVFLGIIASLIFNGSFLKKDKVEQLMSVYELQAHNIPEKNVKKASLERNEDSIVFHHIAHSSVETFATQPCLLEYSAYTLASDNY